MIIETKKGRFAAIRNGWWNPRKARLLPEHHLFSVLR